MKTCIRFVYKNVRIRFIAISKYRVSLSLFILLSVSLKKKCLSGWNDKSGRPGVIPKKVFLKVYQNS